MCTQETHFDFASFSKSVCERAVAPVACTAGGLACRASHTWLRLCVRQGEARATTRPLPLAKIAASHYEIHTVIKRDIRIHACLREVGRERSRWAVASGERAQAKQAESRNEKKQAEKSPSPSSGVRESTAIQTPRRLIRLAAQHSTCSLSQLDYKYAVRKQKAKKGTVRCAH